MYPFYKIGISRGRLTSDYKIWCGNDISARLKGAWCHATLHESPALPYGCIHPSPPWHMACAGHSPPPVLARGQASESIGSPTWPLATCVKVAWGIIGHGTQWSKVWYAAEKIGQVGKQARSGPSVEATQQRLCFSIQRLQISTFTLIIL